MSNYEQITNDITSKINARFAVLNLTPTIKLDWGYMFDTKWLTVDCLGYFYSNSIAHWALIDPREHDDIAERWALGWAYGIIKSVKPV